MKGGRDSAIDLCLSHLNDMSDSTFTTRIAQYGASLKARQRDVDKAISREGLCDRVLSVLEKHRSGNVNSQELFCFGRCISSALSTNARSSLSIHPFSSQAQTSFEWEHTQQVRSGTE